jgi:hypothetical protein
MNAYQTARTIAQDYADAQRRPTTSKRDDGLHIDPVMLKTFRARKRSTLTPVWRMPAQRWVDAVVLTCFLRKKYFRGMK